MLNFDSAGGAPPVGFGGYQTCTLEFLIKQRSKFDVLLVITHLVICRNYVLGGADGFSAVLVLNTDSAGGATPCGVWGGTKRVFCNFSSYKSPNLLYYRLLQSLLHVETMYKVLNMGYQRSWCWILTLQVVHPSGVLGGTKRVFSNFSSYIGPILMFYGMLHPFSTIGTNDQVLYIGFQLSWGWIFPLHVVQPPGDWGMQQTSILKLFIVK